MPSEISNFYNKMISKGVRYSYQYKVSVYGSDIPGTNFGREDFHFYAQGFTLPSRTVEIQEINFQGMKFRLPNNMNYTGIINLNVNCDESMAIRTQCEVWMNVYGNIIAGGGGKKTIPANANVRLDLLNSTLDQDDISRTYVLVGCWPSSIGESTLGQSETGILVFPFTLAYQYYVEGDSGVSPNFQSPADTSNVTG